MSFKFHAVLTGVCVALALVGVMLPAAASDPGPYAFAAERPSDPLKAFDIQARQWALYESLHRDGGALGTEHLHSVAFTQDDMVLMESAGACGTCAGGRLTIAGVNKNLGLVVDFNELQLKSLSDGPLTAFGGRTRITADGRFVWTCAVSSPGADALRIHFTNFHLPPNLEMLVYTDAGEVFGPYVGDGIMDAQEFWSNTVSGGKAFIEVRSFEPVTTQELDAAHFDISEIAHMILEPVVSALKQALPSCTEDASCFDANDWSVIDTVARAVGLMFFDVDDPNVQGICTGGLLTDQAQTFTPYFLSANHCLDTQAAANSLEVVWQHQTQQCNQGFSPETSLAGLPRSLGATLLATAETSDFTFLQLKQDPPQNSVYLGWDASDFSKATGTATFRLHHPRGAPQSFSRAVIKVISPGASCLNPQPFENWIFSDETIGGTVGGSSGSPVCLESGQVIGQLFGQCFPASFPEPPLCTTDITTADGSLHATFPSISDFLQNTNTAPALQLVPASQMASSGAGSASFEVRNTGGGTLNYVAEVIAGTFLSITSGANGAAPGMVQIAFAANSQPTQRIGQIRVTAQGATGSPATYTLTQSGMICSTPPPPSNVAATQGTLSTGVQISWTAAPGATGYQVFRSSTNDSAAATALTGVFNDTSFLDTTADFPSTGAGGCPQNVQFVRFFYFVKAQSGCGASGFSASAEGWRGGTKLAAMVGGEVFLLAAGLGLFWRRSRRRKE